MGGNDDSDKGPPVVDGSFTTPVVRDNNTFPHTLSVNIVVHSAFFHCILPSAITIDHVPNPVVNQKLYKCIYKNHFMK